MGQPKCTILQHKFLEYSQYIAHTIQNITNPVPIKDIITQIAVSHDSPFIGQPNTHRNLDVLCNFPDKPLKAS
jgi:hypothetical protein